MQTLVPPALKIEIDRLIEQHIPSIQVGLLTEISEFALFYEISEPEQQKKNYLTKWMDISKNLMDLRKINDNNSILTSLKISFDVSLEQNLKINPLIAAYHTDLIKLIISANASPFKKDFIISLNAKFKINLISDKLVLGHLSPIEKKNLFQILSLDESAELKAKVMEVVADEQTLSLDDKLKIFENISNSNNHGLNEKLLEILDREGYQITKCKDIIDKMIETDWNEKIVPYLFDINNWQEISPFILKLSKLKANNIVWQKILDEMNYRSIIESFIEINELVTWIIENGDSIIQKKVLELFKNKFSLGEVHKFIEKYFITKKNDEIFSILFEYLNESENNFLKLNLFFKLLQNSYDNPPLRDKLLSKLSQIIKEDIRVFPFNLLVEKSIYSERDLKTLFKFDYRNSEINEVMCSDRLQSLDLANELDNFNKIWDFMKNDSTNEVFVNFNSLAEKITGIFSEKIRARRGQSWSENLREIEFRLKGMGTRKLRTIEWLLYYLLRIAHLQRNIFSHQQDVDSSQERKEFILRNFKDPQNLMFIIYLQIQLIYWIVYYS